MPVKVQPLPIPRVNFIEWQIHNVCNYACSFCGPVHSGGDKRWLGLEESKKVVDKIAEACKSKPFWLQLTGGEPTLMPDLSELLQYIKDKGGYTSMISNGSRTIRWWTEIRDRKLLDMLYITYHPEQTSDIEHVVEVIQLFHNEPVETFCLITHVKNNIQDAFDAFDYIKTNTGTVITVKAMMVYDYDIYDLYTAEQSTRLKKMNWIHGDLSSTKIKSNIPEYKKHKAKLIEIYEDGTIQLRESQSIFKDRTNVYTGWKCNIGKTTLRINVDSIYRGVCGSGGVVGHVSDNEYRFSDDFITCESSSCFCGTDMISTKYKIV